MSTTSQSLANAAFAITPSDSVPLTLGPIAIFVGGSGNITMQFSGSSTDVLFSGVPAGTTLNISPNLIKATGTTATGLVALKF